MHYYFYKRKQLAYVLELRDDETYEIKITLADNKQRENEKTSVPTFFEFYEILDLDINEIKIKQISVEAIKEKASF